MAPVSDSYLSKFGRFIKSIDIPGQKLVGGAIDKFRSEVLQWHKRYLEVKNDRRELPPELQKSRESLIKKGEMIIRVIDKLGIDLNQEAIEKNLGAIFVPVLAGTAAAGVLAYISSWYFDDKQQERKQKLYFDALDSGASHDQAMKVMEGIESPRIFEGGGKILEGTTTKLIIGAVVLGGLYFYFNRKA